MLCLSTLFVLKCDRRRIHDFVRVVIPMMTRKTTGNDELSQIIATVFWSVEYFVSICVFIWQEMFSNLMDCRTTDFAFSLPLWMPKIALRIKHTIPMPNAGNPSRLGIATTDCTLRKYSHHHVHYNFLLFLGKCIDNSSTVQ